MRSRIRIQDGRAKPIDLLAKYASSAEDEGDLSGVEMHEPYTYLNGLTCKDLEDLLEDIKVYMELEQGTALDIKPIFLYFSWNQDFLFWEMYFFFQFMHCIPIYKLYALKMLLKFILGKLIFLCCRGKILVLTVVSRAGLQFWKLLMMIIWYLLSRVQLCKLTNITVL